MNPHVLSAAVAERQRDLRRAAACCTIGVGRRRTLLHRLADRGVARRPHGTAAEPALCCA